MAETDKAIRALPASNPRANGLHLTDAEWAAVLKFVGGEPAIMRAWLYGSRLNGVRRDKGELGPPDIDVAADYGVDDFAQRVRIAATVTNRWGAFLKKFNIHLEHYEATSKEAGDQASGYLLISRDSG